MWVQRTCASLFGDRTPVTNLYLGLCIAVYLFTALKTQSVVADRVDLGFGGVLPSESLRWGALPTPTLLRSIGVEPQVETWRFLSAVFVHLGLIHVGANMFTFHYWGRRLEVVVGSPRFLASFVLTGVAGFVVSQYGFPTHGPGLTAGASGGLTGIMGTVVGLLFARRDPAWKSEGMRVLLFIVLIAIVFPHVNNAAHGGGLCAGFVFGIAFGKERQAFRRDAAFRALAGLLLVLTAASLTFSNLSPVWKLQRVREIQGGAIKTATR
jgi:membrane associated rhomboid family serine protease